ncbi:MAG TPA: HemK family protein methyltransferase [Candidatus Acidoferrales bacterium]|nr:HemK family protein methyltransferase [Candidatus Acidoferrales bacterium]
MRTRKAGVEALTELLAREGFLAADDEAAALTMRAGGDADLLQGLVARRLTGEPLAWIVGTATFCDLTVRVDPGVYVPRWLTEPLARRAADRLPSGGSAVDLCTGSGAIAMTLAAAHPGARVVGSDLDDRAVACAIANGVEAYRGDLFAPLPADLQGAVDVVVGVVPYVPTAELPLLQRDTFTFEGTLAYDGGSDGTDILRRVLEESTRWLRARGALLLELGGQQADLIAGDLERLGYEGAIVHTDEDGDVRGIEVTLRP